MNLRDMKRLKRSMIESIELLHKNRMYVAATVLVACYIDALADGKGSKFYCAFLEKHFPDMCRELGAATFYKMYRCGMVHELSMGNDFAIANDSEIDGRYVDTVQVGEMAPKVALNIDRLSNDFISVVKTI